MKGPFQGALLAVLFCLVVEHEMHAQMVLYFCKKVPAEVPANLIG